MSARLSVYISITETGLNAFYSGLHGCKSESESKLIPKNQMDWSTDYVLYDTYSPTCYIICVIKIVLVSVNNLNINRYLSPDKQHSPFSKQLIIEIQIRPLANAMFQFWKILDAILTYLGSNYNSSGATNTF